MPNFENESADFQDDYARFETGRKLYLLNQVAPIFGLLLALIFIVGIGYVIFTPIHQRFYYLGLEILGVSVALFSIGAKAATSRQAQLGVRCVVVAACVAVIIPYICLVANSGLTIFVAIGFALFAMVIVLVGIIGDGALLRLVTVLLMLSSAIIVWMIPVPTTLTLGDRFIFFLEILIIEFVFALLMANMNGAYQATMKTLGNVHGQNRLLTHEMKTPVGSLRNTIMDDSERHTNGQKAAFIQATITLIEDMINTPPWERNEGSRLKKIHLGTALTHVRESLIREGIAKSSCIQLPAGAVVNRYILGYYTNIYSLFRNILANALQAIALEPDPHISIQLTLHQPSQPGTVEHSRNGIPFTIIHIQNNGGHIPDTELPFIFEKDYTTKQDGKGVGLWLCQRYVVIMGGWIRVKNIYISSKKGVRFSVALQSAEYSTSSGDRS